MVSKVFPILVWPNEILSQPCNDVEEFDDSIRQLVNDMFYTMETNRGVGLAAPQIGKSLNIFVIQYDTEYDEIDGTALTTKTGRSPRYVFINPKIVEVDDTYQFAWDEGCLSVPGYYEKRKRPQRIVIEYQNEFGTKATKEFQGFIAFAIQHEYDHLQGKIFVDDLSNLKKDRVKNKIKKFLRRR
jgi:peptide deformylase